MSPAERFCEEHYGQEEVDRRCNILHEPDRSKAQTPGRGREPEQGYRGDDAGQGEEDIVSDSGGRKRPFTRDSEVDEVAGGGWKEEERLHGEPDQGAGRNDLAQEPVKCKGDRQYEGYPWDAAEMESQDDHPDACKGQAQHLEPPQPLSEKDETEQHRDKGIDEVAEARLEYLAAVHRNNEDKPVGGDEDGGGAECDERLSLRQGSTNLAPLTGGGERDHERDKGPGDAVGEHFQRGDMGHPFEVEGEEPPEEVCGEAVGDPHAGFAGAVMGRMDKMNLRDMEFIRFLRDKRTDVSVGGRKDQNERPVGIPAGLSDSYSLHPVTQG